MAYKYLEARGDTGRKNLNRELLSHRTPEKSTAVVQQSMLALHNDTGAAQSIPFEWRWFIDFPNPGDPSLVTPDVPEHRVQFTVDLADQERRRLTGRRLYMTDGMRLEPESTIQLSLGAGNLPAVEFELGIILERQKR